MMKNNKGVTLTEVLVSIVVLGIAFATSFSVLSTTNNLTIANERKTNTFTEVESLLEMFSSDPEKFSENIKSVYNITEKETGDDYQLYRIYYSSAFIKAQDKTDSSYYIDIRYSYNDVTVNNSSKILTSYKIDIKVFHNKNIFMISDEPITSLEIVK